MKKIKSVEWTTLLYVSFFRKSLYTSHTRDLQVKSFSQHLTCHSNHDACGLLEDKRITSFTLQDNVNFIVQGLLQSLLHDKCSLNISQNKRVYKYISRYVLLWINLTFDFYTLISVHSQLYRVLSTAENYVYLQQI